MTIFSDEVLMLNAAEMEEWYEHELIRRSEFELRMKPPPAEGGSAAAAAAPISFLQATVGLVPAQFNLLPNTVLDGSNPGFPNGPGGSVASAWSVTGSSVARTNANTTAGPDSVTTNQFLAEDTSNGNHAITILNSPVPPSGAITSYINCKGTGTKWRYAFIAKARQRKRIVAQFAVIKLNVTSKQISVGFDLVGGNTGYDNSIDAGFTLLATNITSLPNGFWLCTMDFELVLQTPVTTEDANWNFLQPLFYLDAGTGTGPRNISYAGDGASGAWIWWENLLPLGAWNLTNLSFFDDFLDTSTIDLTNSGAPGFNWYLRGDFSDSWKNQVIAAGWGVGPGTVCPASRISVSNSVLTIQGHIFDAGNTGPGTEIYSAYDNGPLAAGGKGGPGSFVGKGYTVPAIFEARMSWPDRDTSFWTESLECNMGLPLGFVDRELDVQEAITGNGGLHSQQTLWHQEVLPANPSVNPAPCGFPNLLANEYDNSADYNADGTQNVMHRYAAMVLPPWANDNQQGICLSFEDGVYVNRTLIAWSRNFPGYFWATGYGSGSPPCQDPGDHIAQDYHRQVLILQPKNSVPVNVVNFDWVRVIQPSNPVQSYPNQSVVLIAAQTQFFSRTVGTPDNALICTISIWVKLASTGVNQALFACSSGGELFLTSANVIRFINGAAISVLSTTTLTDTTTWHGIVCAIDTTQAIAASRVHIYLDGVEVSYDAATNYGAQNDNPNMQVASSTQFLGINSASAHAFNGSMAFMNFIDGFQKSISNSVAGQTLTGPFSIGTGPLRAPSTTSCHPIRYRFLFGTQGSNLEFGFSDGRDTSTNTNNWTSHGGPTYAVAPG